MKHQNRGSEVKTDQKKDLLSNKKSFVWNKSHDEMVKKYASRSLKVDDDKIFIGDILLGLGKMVIEYDQWQKDIKVIFNHFEIVDDIKEKDYTDSLKMAIESLGVKVNKEELRFLRSYEIECYPTAEEGVIEERLCTPTFVHDEIAN